MRQRDSRYVHRPLKPPGFPTHHIDYLQFTASTTNANAEPTSKHGKHSSMSSTRYPSPRSSPARSSASTADSVRVCRVWMILGEYNDRLVRRSHAMPMIHNSPPFPIPADVPDYGLLNDLVWSDPSDTALEWEDNERGVSYCYGKAVINAFLATHVSIIPLKLSRVQHSSRMLQDMDLICRAHMVVEVSIFSPKTLFPHVDMLPI